MKLRYVSDLHFEHRLQSASVTQLVQKFIPPTEGDSQTVLVLAGDICSKREHLKDALLQLASRFKHVFMVAGNHEFYGYNMDEYAIHVRDSSWTPPQSNLTFVVKGVESVILEGVRFVLSPLWADGGSNPMETHVIQEGMWDFRQIYIGTGDDARTFHVGDMHQLNKENRDHIRYILENVPFPGKTVVITHHLPSHYLCHPRHGHIMNGGFASDCGEMMLDETTAPYLWIFGHTHDTMDTRLFNTRCVSNPLGYRFELDKAFHRFDPTAHIDL